MTLLASVGIFIHVLYSFILAHEIRLVKYTISFEVNHVIWKHEKHNDTKGFLLLYYNYQILNSIDFEEKLIYIKIQCDFPTFIWDGRL